MGLYARFEDGRKDAVLRSIAYPPPGSDEIAVEWEWSGIEGNELKKLKNHEVLCTNINRIWQKRPEGLLKYAVLITYTDTLNLDDIYLKVGKYWKGSRWPLLLILIQVEKSKEFFVMLGFKNMRMSVFKTDGQRNDLRSIPAFPWNIENTRWYGWYHDK